MKKIILPIVVLASTTVYSQVGINTADPKATMDINAKTNDGSKPEGLIAPRLTGDQIRSANAQYAAAQTGTIVYATSADSAPAGATANITTAGYYYFDGSVWQKVNTGTGGSTGDTTNDAWINLPGNTRVELGTLSNGTTARPAGTEFVALDNGNVGIGNTSPGVKLTVNAAGDMNGINLNNNTSAVGTRTRFGIGTGSPNWAALFFTNVSSTVSRFGIGDYLTANEYLSVNTSGSSMGNVGINNISPDTSAQLDVAATNKGFLPPRVTLTNATSASPITLPATGLTVYHTGNAALTAGLYTNIGTPAAPNWVAGTGNQDTTNDAWVNNPSGNRVELGTLSNGSTARPTGTEVVANDSGYLGLGTITPTSRVHIVGDGGANDDILVNSSSSTSTGSTGTLYFSRSRGTSSAKTAVNSGDSLGSLTFRGYDGSADIQTASVLAAANGTVGAGSVPTDLVLSTGATSATEKMRVTSGGNVGVGTNNPTNKLQVNVTTSGDGATVVNSNPLASGTTRTKIGIGGGNPTWGAINYFNTNNTSGRVSLGSYEGLEYLTYNTTGANIGNIGINNTNPDVSAQLDVSATNKGFLPPRIALAAAADATTIPTPATGLTIYNTGGSLVAGLYTNIGTPATPNWVAGTGSQDTSNDAWVNDSANSIVKLGTLSNGSTARPTGTEVVANDSGYLGLGTTTPGYRIHITGDGGTNDDIKIASSANTPGGTGSLFFNRSRGTTASRTSIANGDFLGTLLFEGFDGTSNLSTAAIAALSNGTMATGSLPTDLLFYTGANGTTTERLRITSAGNVGIGNSSPGVKLVVTPSGDMNGMNLINSTSTNGTRTRFGIGAGNPNYAALYYTNVSSTVGRFGIGDYVTSNEYLSINTGGSNQGNIGINNTSPDPSAALDVSATNKGVLLPRVSLNSLSDITTVPNPATGLLVYNTGTGSLSAKGYYFWNGTTWDQMKTSSSSTSSANNVNLKIVTGTYTSAAPYVVQPDDSYILLRFNSASTPDGIGAVGASAPFLQGTYNMQLPDPATCQGRILTFYNDGFQAGFGTQNVYTNYPMYSYDGAYSYSARPNDLSYYIQGNNMNGSKFTIISDGVRWINIYISVV